MMLPFLKDIPSLLNLMSSDLFEVPRRFTKTSELVPDPVTSPVKTVNRNRLFLIHLRGSVDTFRSVGIPNWEIQLEHAAKNATSGLLCILITIRSKNQSLAVGSSSGRRTLTFTISESSRASIVKTSVCDFCKDDFLNMIFRRRVLEKSAWLLLWILFSWDL